MNVTNRNTPQPCGEGAGQSVHLNISSKRKAALTKLRIVTPVLSNRRNQMNTQSLIPNNPLDQKTTKDLLVELVGVSAADALWRTFGSLAEMAKGTETEISLLANINIRRARLVKAAFLLAQKLAHDRQPERPLLDTPEKVADLLREENRAYRVECFQLAMLDTRRRLIRVVIISQGTLDTLLVHPREVFRHAIILSAAAVILIHNHPSSDPTPSQADITITRDLIRAGQLMKIEVLDHVILGGSTTERPKDYVSLRELGFFQS
ncbi:MAG: JAB domain-containing protein [Limisphaerales bacterium]